MLLVQDDSHANSHELCASHVMFFQPAVAQKPATDSEMCWKLFFFFKRSSIACDAQVYPPTGDSAEQRLEGFDQRMVDGLIIIPLEGGGASALINIGL